MTREELLEMVNGKVNTTKFKSLTQKTINEELDDVLDELGDDEETNDKIITKLANRLKRMDGNVHKSVSDEMKKNKEAEEERKRLEEEERKRKEREENNHSEDSKYDELLKEIKALKDANAARDKKAARSAAIESIKKGLKDKFDRADLDLNEFFLDTALSKLEIPDDDIDVVDLVSKAEGIYTADYKRANGGSAIPKKGQGSQANHSSDDDDKYIDEVAERRKKKYDSDAKK